jgi:hypothetical protein
MRYSYNDAMRQSSQRLMRPWGFFRLGFGQIRSACPVFGARYAKTFDLVSRSPHTPYSRLIP